MGYNRYYVLTCNGELEGLKIQLWYYYNNVSEEYLIDLLVYQPTAMSLSMEYIDGILSIKNIEDSLLSEKQMDKLRLFCEDIIKNNF